MPLIVNYSSDATSEAIPEVMFVVSTTNKMPPIGILKTDQPQALLIRMGPSGHVDVLKQYLPALEKIEGLPVAEFLERAKNAGKEFAAAPGDDEKVQHEKQQMGIVFNESRFQMQALYRETDPKAFADPDALIAFVKEALSGNRPLHWLSEKPKV